MRDPQCRIEQLFAKTVSSQPVSSIPSMAPDTAAMVLITILDPATSKACASTELMTTLRSPQFWRSFGEWLEGPVRGLGLPAVTGLLCRLTALKMNRPSFMKVLAEELSSSHVATAPPEYIAQAVAMLVPPRSVRESDAAVEKVFAALRQRAKDHWGGRELIVAIRGANSAVSRYGEAARTGVLSVAQIFDEVACEKVESLDASDAYTLISELEESRLKNGRLMGIFLQNKAKGNRSIDSSGSSKRASG